METNYLILKIKIYESHTGKIISLLRMSNKLVIFLLGKSRVCARKLKFNFREQTIARKMKFSPASGMGELMYENV